MKKLILFLLPLLALAQNPTNFPYGIKNTVAPSNSTPSYFVTQEVDGVHKKTPAANVEKTANKSDSYTASSSTTYASTKAVVDGLATKISGTGTTNYLPKFTSAGVLGNSQIFDNGSRVWIGGTDNGVDKLQVNGSALFYSKGGVVDLQTAISQAGIKMDYSANQGLGLYFGSIGIGGGAFKYIQPAFADGSNFGTLCLSPYGGNVLIGTTTDNGVDKLQVNGTISATNYTGGATLTGTPTAPTAAVGTNTTQIATTAFVQAAATSNIAQTITNGVTNSAPSQDAVFDALALKANMASATFTGQATFNGGAIFPAGASIHFNTGGSGLIDDVSGNYFYTSYPVIGWISNAPITATQYKISALNTAPASATDTGVLGEVRITATYIYVCTATNTWVRTALATW